VILPHPGGQVRRKAVAHKRGVILGLVLGIFLGWLVASMPVGSTDEHEQVIMDEFFRPLAWVVSQVEARYVEPPDYDKLLKGATQGVMSILDDYSTYIPADMMAEFRADTKGEFGGLGISIRFLPVKKAVLVEEPIPGTPAFAAGLLAGDLIIRVREGSTGQEIATSEMEDVHEAVKVLRGEPGTKVTITVLHGEDGEREELTLTRAIIKVPGVRAVEMLDPDSKIGYAYVAYFHEHVTEDLSNAIEDLLGQGAKALVLDLRFNPGGLLDSAVDCADIFLNDGKIVRTKGRTSPEHTYMARRGEIASGIPIVVLINGSSASASEIVAAALRDHGRAELVGQKTFGKASVQTVVENPHDQSGLKLTTAHYYTPLDQEIEDKGVEPTVEVVLSDEQLRDLMKHIGERAGFAVGDEESGETETSEPFRDVQLERAMELLRTKLAGQAPDTKELQEAVALQPVGS
jgi:carboxyl-terminal processing protease